MTHFDSQNTDAVTCSTPLSNDGFALFEEHFHFIHNLIRKRIPSRLHYVADPEQIAIDAILKAIRKMEFNLVHSRREHTCIKAYCIVVANNLAMNAVRNIRREFGNETNVRYAWFNFSDERYRSNDAETHDDYHALLSHLNLEQKTIMHLRFIGHSNGEIADQLNTSVRKVERIRNEIRNVALVRQLYPSKRGCPLPTAHCPLPRRKFRTFPQKLVIQNKFPRGTNLETVLI